MDTGHLKNWFLQEKRTLPWRENPSPYAVWVSEVMLQQTQVSVVIPYFERWMNRFPTVKSLAEAPLDEVIKAWEGLGYYSRARNLHQGAKIVLEEFNGIIPRSASDLQKIKGLGPYTIGAIRSFAFNEKEPAVDGNVIRVMTRHFTIDKDISKSSTVKEIRTLTAGILPDEEPWIITEALIELGATICTRKPKCNECPLQRSCLAFRHSMTEKFPVKTVKSQTIYLYRIVPVISCGNDLLIKRGAEGKVMCDLHEFPYLEVSQDEIESFDILTTLKTTRGIDAHSITSLPEESHSFTKYRVRLFPRHVTCRKKVPVKDHEWISTEKLKNLAFSSGHKRIFQNFLAESIKKVS